MHMLSRSVSYMQNIEGTQWKLLKKFITQSMFCQPLFIRCSLQEMAKFKGYLVVFQNQISLCACSIGL